MTFLIAGQSGTDCSQSSFYLTVKTVSVIHPGTLGRSLFMMEHVKPRGVITRQSMNEYRLCLCDHGIKFAWWQHPAMGQRARLHATLLTIVLCQWSRVHN